MRKLDPVLNHPLVEEGACQRRAADVILGSTACHARSYELAKHWVAALREQTFGLDTIEGLMQLYPLDTAEGLALMRLAESLLRTGGGPMAGRLLADKLSQGDWAAHAGRHGGAARWLDRLLAVGRQVETAHAEQPRWWSRLADRYVQKAARAGIARIGRQFIAGQDLPSALRNLPKTWSVDSYSFDMLGEGARTQADADRYFTAYRAAIDTLHALPAKPQTLRPSISVKLSALHPRFEDTQRVRVLDELVPRLLQLVERAAHADIPLTIDAEESERLHLTSDVLLSLVEQLDRHPDERVRAWQGLGIAVQAYQRRALPLVDELIEVARTSDRRLQIRLVKGAYWDSEISRAQQLGLTSYPVFTTKAGTDLNYLACARRLLDARPAVYPMLATHNAHTLATVLAYAEDGTAHSGFDFEIQRLFGMGEALLEQVRKHPQWRDLPCRIYTPIGAYQDALAYLVRRLLENGANTSFVRAVHMPANTLEDLATHPYDICLQRLYAPAAELPDPPELFADRRNSQGHDLMQRTVQQWAQTMSRRAAPADMAVPLPVDEAVQSVRNGFPDWSRRPAGEHARCLRDWADALEHRTPDALSLLINEARKTYADALAEIRETVDFLRYYATQAERLFALPQILPGPAGESNTLSWHGRGVWACISPWNFPLAIFVGQIAAALAAGNTVAAKPAPQTPLIAAWAVAQAHAAGLPADCLQLIEASVDHGERLIGHPGVDGVAFTGSTLTARHIARALADRPGALAPLIAETGGVNAMVVDATALPEQVCDAVLESAFRSAGQRCSALRVLFVDASIADRVVVLLLGALRERRVGPQDLIDTDIGPLIDAAAVARVRELVKQQARLATAVHRLELSPAQLAKSDFFEPMILEMPYAAADQALATEIFGPILQVVRYPTTDFEAVLERIAASGWGLTFGLQSRIDARIEQVCRLPVGNIYINRSMIGATVGVQPFGGQGLSGTGPKAGGPHSLQRFAIERTLSINTAAAGGNIELLMGGRLAQVRQGRFD
jgi:RHH-type proline utilization regulon transcriptional repressor/proline dehydrogenase/delta 1-pyrroline-5-carboxylate dehydrogenase